MAKALRTITFFSFSKKHGLLNPLHILMLTDSEKTDPKGALHLVERWAIQGDLGLLGFSSRKYFSNVFIALISSAAFRKVHLEPSQGGMPVTWLRLMIHPISGNHPNAPQKRASPLF